MNCQRCTEIVAGDDGRPTPAEAADFAAHLAACPTCATTNAAREKLRVATGQLRRELPPSRDLWTGIESRLSAPANAEDMNSAGAGRKIIRWFAPLAVAAAAAVLLTVGEQSFRPATGPAWQVASTEGAPRINARPITGSGQLRVGQWLETDRTSRARVEVGAIGHVSVEPDSRLRLVDASPTDHRLELVRGELRALIWAPPRLFFVNTPSATAVDLGCAYTLKVDDDGDGELHVTSGYVALENDGRESIIPMGAMCYTRRGAGPGTPFAADADDRLRRALERFDFSAAPHRAAALDEVLAAARPEDALTLWHLLTRAEAAQRGAVFDVLNRLAPAPEGVTREGILALNAQMHRAWGERLGLMSWATATK